MRRIVLFLLLAVLLPICAQAASPVSVQLFAGDHFSFAIPEKWEMKEQEGLCIFLPPEETLSPAFISVEEIDVSDFAPFQVEDVYAGLADALGGQGSGISIDGHAASLVELQSETGCLCTVLYCRGMTVLALSVTSPDSDPAEIRSLLMNLIRYTAYLG